MTSQLEHAEAFHALHVRGDPVVLFNVWDAGSAGAVAKAGAKAIATGSWSVATANGYCDGEATPLELVIANVTRIVGAVQLPVTLDLEGGYGGSPQAVAETVMRLLATGAVGFNIEDQVIGGVGLHSIETQSARIGAARDAAQAFGMPVFINARNDFFLQSIEHDATLVDAALERAHAYAKAGASGFFAPGLVEVRLIEKLCASSPLPVNLMMSPKSPSPARLAELGAARISHGPGPYRLAMRALADAAREAHSST
ncbi:MAG: isocitrate lyase/phosphoenolpyruvate mutase family protein [Lysobacterales bacterium]